MLSHFLKNKALAGVGIGLLITLLILPLSVFKVFDSLHLHFADSLYTLNEPSDEIVIIAVDDKSTQSPPTGFGLFQQWNRERFTDVMEVLEKEKAKVIAIDFTFRASSQSVPKEKFYELEEEIYELSNKEKLQKFEDFLTGFKSSLDDPIDMALAEKFQKFDNLILAASISGDTQQLLKPLLEFSVNAGLGLINAELDSKGILRQSIPYFNFPEENKTYPDLGVAAAEQYLGKENLALPLEDGKLNVNFFGDPYSYKMIPFVDVVNEQFPPDTFKDKIVLIGSTSSKVIHDEYYTPRSNVSPMPGIEFRANEIQTILDGKFLNNQSTFGQILAIAIVSVLLAIALNYLGIILGVLISLGMIAVYIFAAHFFYSRGLILNMFYPFLAIILTYLAAWVYKYFVADKSKREIKSAFGHYLSTELVDQIAKNPDIVKLGGEKKIITVFFSDIKDSTAHSEKTEITSWVSQMNEYFTAMENVLKAYGGTLDKYEGDAVMGFFNAPLDQTNHVLRAYLTAISMQKALMKLHEKWKLETKPLIEFRLGINTGEALVGNFGSKDRFNYTAMGDTVNTASRLESAANKTYGTKMMIAGFNGILSAEDAAKIVMREIDTVLLPGKKEPVNLFELVGLREESNESMSKILNAYAQGLLAYRKKDFVQATENFKACGEDNPAKIILTRCEILMKGEQISELDEKMVFRILNK